MKFLIPPFSYGVAHLVFLMAVFFSPRLHSQTIASISEIICDSIHEIDCRDLKTCDQLQRSIYNDEMLKYPTLVVDITDLNKPHQYNEFNYKVNRELLKSCKTYTDQFSLLPLSKILDIEGLFNKNQYDSLERIIIEFIHVRKTDLLVISMEDYFPYNSSKEFIDATFDNWNVGKRYANGGIIIFLSKKNNEVWIRGNDESTDIMKAVNLEKVRESTCLPAFAKAKYFEAVYLSIRKLNDER